MKSLFIKVFGTTFALSTLYTIAVFSIDPDSVWLWIGVGGVIVNGYYLSKVLYN